METQKPMVLGVTGADGLIGWHIRAYFHGVENVDVVTANRQTFADDNLLDAFVVQCDAIAHFAGINRASDEQLEFGNIALTTQLIESLERTNHHPHLLFASSTHVLKYDSAYARGKRACSQLWSEWSARHRARFTNLILPHVFGEGGKPFYNSVVSTFCHQLIQSEIPSLDKDAELELLHAQDVAVCVKKIIESGRCGDVRIDGVKIRVSDLLALLQGLYHSYFESFQFPNLSKPLMLSLFNTLRSYSFPARYPLLLDTHSDSRGFLYEAVKGQQGGQCFVSGTHPDITRGNHYHRNKVERFLVISGEAKIAVRRLFSKGISYLSVSGDTPVCVDMPTFHVHNIKNVGTGELLTLFWAHEVFDREFPDTYSEQVVL